MPTPLEDDQLSSILPGTWNVRGTNVPMWLSNERRSPRFDYELAGENPLTLRDRVSYFATKDNEEKQLSGVIKWAHNGFVWRGRGYLRFFASRWSVIGSNETHSVLAIRFQKTLLTHAGINVIVRDGEDIDEVRSLVARNTEEFGLSAEDFASLTWLEPETLPASS
jgi:hypothetical protein